MSSPDVMSSPRALPDRRSRRRDSRPTNRNVSSPYYRDASSSSSSTSMTTNFFSSFTWPGSNFATEQTISADLLNSLDLLSPTQTDPTRDPLLGGDDAWLAVGPHSPSSVGSGSILLDQTLNYLIAQSVTGPQSPVSSRISVSSPSWEIVPSARGRGDSDIQDFMQDNPSGVRDNSLENEGQATPNTFASSFSEGLALPTSSPGYASPMHGGNEILRDMTLPGEFYNHRYLELLGENFEHQTSSFPNSIPFDTNFLHAQSGLDNQFIFGSNALSFSDFVIPQSLDHQFQQGNVERSNVPWDSQSAQINGFGAHATAGDVTFEPARGGPYDIHQDRERLLSQQTQVVSPVYGPAAPISIGDEIDEPFRFESDLESPSSQPPFAHHSHVFSANPATEVPDNRGGRKRRLTEEEREHTLKVRTLGACWACHLSKTRCSPCGPGSPCEQCTRLLNKRRFYHLSCFNDPIESLNTFLIPDYLVGHITSSNVEAFVKNNVSAWGAHSLAVKMIWGCGQPFEVIVENLFFDRNSSLIAYAEQALVDESGRARLVRLRCPPLGIPLASDVRDLRLDFREYLRNLVRTDLQEYAAEAYDEPNSEVPARLLQAVCEWYTAGIENGVECPILRHALETHISCTMMERSFVLDGESVERVQTLLNQDFPSMSTPTCAQRQMKLALFSLQQPRIEDVLQRWGKMMHSSANTENKWEIAFCVFILLTLIMDKTIAAAHTLCEKRIQFEGCDEREQKSMFQELVTLMQREFFERCKEIFHSRFKTRRNGKESCNPIRDNEGAWRGRDPPEFRTVQLIGDVQRVMRDFGIGRETRPSAQSSRHGEHGDAQEYIVGDNVYANLGRLATIFLRDFK